MQLALAQINPTVGDFEGNLARIRKAARSVEASLVVFPELAVCGYMPRDLLREPSFIDACERARDILVADADLPPIVVGCPTRAEGPGKPLLNTALLIRGGRVDAVAKRLLPTYDVFDERRYFRPGPACAPIDVDGERLGITICEDIWTGPVYEDDPVADLVGGGAELIVNLSASPYYQGKPEDRRQVARAHVARHGVPFVLCNLVGGNDQLIFDGNSFSLDAQGNVSAHLAHCREEVRLLDGASTVPGGSVFPDSVRDALVLGIRDYFAKTGFSQAVIGMSGGVDSSLVASLAAEALGQEKVLGIGMPGPFNAPMSLEDAQALAEQLGIRFEVLAIDEPFEAFRRQLGSREIGLPEENLQARVRGTYLMTRANELGALVLVPSNKSELAMGYCTLYGDMVGALAPISDLYKGKVYELGRACGLPARVLERPPSAELRPGQTDQDTLPPYEVLDEVLRLHLEERLRPHEIEERGFEPAVVDRILKTVARFEYKRQQGSPVLKVSRKAFGLGGRRFPIVERFGGGAAWR
jgi:NAD+ synthetase